MITDLEHKLRDAQELLADAAEMLNEISETYIGRNEVAWHTAAMAARDAELARGNATILLSRERALSKRSS